MPFRFAYICRLLDKLHHIFARHPPYLPHDVHAMSQRVITLWFKKHQYDIKDVDGFLLLSYLFSDKHDEREFGISEEVLARIIGRAWSVSKEQFKAMLEPANPGDRSDLGDRVEQITQQQVGKISSVFLGILLTISRKRHTRVPEPMPLPLKRSKKCYQSSRPGIAMHRTLPNPISLRPWEMYSPTNSDLYIGTVYQRSANGSRCLL